MRVWMASDLHFEQSPNGLGTLQTDCDVVVLAGDIGQGTLALIHARRAFPHHPIIQIAGNHEFFGGVHDQTLAAMRRMARQLDIDFLEGDRVVRHGVEFLGCTLWTDFALYARADRPVPMTVEEAMARSERTMWDGRCIEVRDSRVPLGRRRYRPTDSRLWHQHSVAWLRAALQQPTLGPRVVVTHHLPSWQSVAPRYRSALSNPAFASDLDDLMASVDLWVHGHTHVSVDYQRGRCRVLCNPRGYARPNGAFENPQFDPACVVQLGCAQGD